jgi:hypothetical protein
MEDRHFGYIKEFPKKNTAACAFKQIRQAIILPPLHATEQLQALHVRAHDFPTRELHTVCVL